MIAMLTAHSALLPLALQLTGNRLAFSVWIVASLAVIGAVCWLAWGSRHPDDGDPS